MVDIQKNETQVLRIEPTTFKGYDLVGIWVWVKSRETDEFVPTGKGVAFQRKLLPEVINALQEIYKKEFEG